MRRFAAIHQFHPGTAQGDAITQQMLELRGHLERLGYVSDIFAEHIAPSLESRIRPIHDYEGSEENLLLMHHSLGSGIFEEVVDLPDRIAAIYHNLTPERYFTDENFRHLLRLGHEQLALLSRRAVVGIADSNYNRREMLAVGFRRVEVMPVRVDYTQFSDGAVDPTLRSSDWLYVGRIVGNKCQHDLVRAFSLYAKTFDDQARLVLIGDTVMRDYVDKVQMEAERLGVSDRVVILGKVTDKQLISAFAGAGVFVSMSEHEGFGVPIVEAMAAGVPVIAFAAAAVPEVMGGAGILLRDKSPGVVAATAQSLREDPDFRDRLVARQSLRVQQIQSFDLPAMLERVIARASGDTQRLEVQVQGPFETSYSLATMNREIARCLDLVPQRAVSIYATEGPGDYSPNPADLAKHPRATELYERSRKVPYPDVVIRQMWPPRVIDSPGGITCEYFGWEESLIPSAMAEDFNRYLDGVAVMSNFVKDVIIDSGVDVPVRVVGLGVPPHDPKAEIRAPELEELPRFRFLNISSAFPRKGIDVLLNAYFSAFDRSDDVTLIIKSFPNPHNDVEQLLREARSAHPNPPDVRWIDRDLDASEIAGLYNLSSCYVHPARGEGFGLPVAEAMLAQVPVITLAYSGLADFISDDTAATIPYRLESAQTHFNVPNSMWAEPDAEQLAVEMRLIYTEPDRAEIKERIRAASKLIKAEFTWDAVARRFDGFIADLEDLSEVPKVAMVTTWNSRCGVAENSSKIVTNAGDRVSFEIFAEKQSEIVNPELEAGVVRNWISRWSPELDQLDGALQLFDPDVVHIQFNLGFFELERLAGLIRRQLESRAVVITFHRTRDTKIDGELTSLGSIRSALEQADQLIVHQESDARILEGFGLTSNVSIVPIGCAPPVDISVSEARDALRLGDRRIVATFGFLLPHKGLLELLASIDSLRIDTPDICLLALCARHPDVNSRLYEEVVRKEIEERNLSNNVLLITDYLPEDTIRAVLRSADAIVLPYRETEESSSAAIRFVLPLERPVIATDLQIFADCRDAILTIEPNDPSAIEDAMRRVLNDEELADDLANRARLFAKRLRWSRIITEHREIYAAARRSYRERVSVAGRRESASYSQRSG
jgi:glycosyltransferase involved in cell wall biosynthesis